MATTHHPQTNGLTERLNRTLIDMIRKYTHAHPGRWGEYLPIFELAYNRSVHATTGIAPFMADRGYIPVMPAQLLITPRQIACSNPNALQIHANELRKALKDSHQIIKRNEEKVWRQVKNREDRKRGGYCYKEGDEVMLYWLPFRSFHEGYKKHKLRYVGPYRVSKVVQTDVLELEGLPERMPKQINVQYLHPYHRDDDDILRQLRDTGENEGTALDKGDGGRSREPPPSGGAAVTPLGNAR